MNLVDLGVIIVLALGFVLGWYKGFLVTVLNLCSYVISWVVAFFAYPHLASHIQQTDFGSTLLYYTAGAEKLSDMSVANVPVQDIGFERIKEILSTSEIPKAVENMILDNIQNGAFSSMGISTLSDYFNQTLINLTLSLVSFLIIFFAVKLVCLFVIGLVDYVVKLPVLKQCDKLIGGAVGVLLSVVFVWVIFSIVPIFMSVLPLEDFNTLIQESFLGKLFFDGNVIFNVLKSVL